MENLQKHVNDLEIELRGRHHRRDREDSFKDHNYIAGESSRGSRSCRLRDRSRETMERYHESPHRERHRHYNATLVAMSRALRRAARSPFSNEIERTKMLRRFTWSPFTIYDGKTDLMEHVSHYIQMMSLYSHNDGLMLRCSRPTSGRQQ